MMHKINATGLCSKLKEAVSMLIQPLNMWSRPESNWDLTFRKRLVYPLTYKTF